MAGQSSRGRRRALVGGGFILGGLVVALLLAFLVSGFASSAPDGLERVAEDKGFLETARDHAFADSPLADYSLRGVDNPRLSTGLAGVIGVLVTFAVGAGLAALVRRRTPPDRDATRTPPGRGPAGRA
jgi:cobalt/nickel transport protein